MLCAPRVEGAWLEDEDGVAIFSEALTPPPQADVALGIEEDKLLEELEFPPPKAVKDEGMAGDAARFRGALVSFPVMLAVPLAPRVGATLEIEEGKLLVEVEFSPPSIPKGGGLKPL